MNRILTLDFSTHKPEVKNHTNTHNTKRDLCIAQPKNHQPDNTIFKNKLN
ncbi:hypothetical protein BAZSYMA_ACONTIG00088_0 [Bathymodiolus azoricus thioautotrophic gill symbiont]|uniref:Uncharacterized protein n=1 Tax=Bathymodiolus azoricus thioautotrophic gill symbiont TaxID=235205 RepID=A0A1H6M3Q1_9GAMM|nr:hypothetical protein BAZSYMA_ACONTIG00088_0 [Bathymodiolus azoricus thioautotrophic gill symbiont]